MRDTFAALTAMLVRLVPLATRPGVHPRRNEVFLLELLRMANQRHVLTDAYVPRTPCLEVPNRPEPPMVHNVLGAAVAPKALKPPSWPRRHGCRAALAQRNDEMGTPPRS